MSFLIALKALIASKTVAVGAGTALVAGGLAVASPQVFLLEPATDSTLEETELTEDVDSSELNGEEEISEPPVEAEAIDAGDEDPVTDDGTECPAEDGEIVPTDEGDACADLDDANQDDADETTEDDDADSGPSEQGLTNRSQTAKDVHGVIENRESYDTGREFGADVSEAARGDRGKSGKDVSEAARGERGNDGNGKRTEDKGGENVAHAPVVEDESVEVDSLPSSGDDSAAKEGNGKDDRPAHAGGPKG